MVTMVFGVPMSPPAANSGKALKVVTIRVDQFPLSLKIPALSKLPLKQPKKYRLPSKKNGLGAKKCLWLADGGHRWLSKSV